MIRGMRTSLRLRLFAPLLLAAIAFAPARAATGDWGANGLEISNWLERTGAIASDGSGGAFVVTMMVCCGYGDSVLVRHVLPTGALDPSWPPGGRLLFNGREMGEVHAIADGHGGLFVLWSLCGPTTPCSEQSTHRLSHVEANGSITPGWPSDGLQLPVTALLSWHDGIRAVGDGTGGLIVGWLGPADAWPVDSLNVYAQRYGANGTRWWPTSPGEEGMRVCTAPRRQFGIRVSRDGTGGAWLAWNDRRAYLTGSGQDIYAMRVRAGGTMAWSANGRRIVRSPSGARVEELASMDSARATLVYVEGSQADLQRVDDMGNASWAGPPVLGVPQTSSRFSLVPHRDGQVSVMWRDLSAFQHWQRFAGDGSLLWQDPTGSYEVFDCMLTADVDDGDLALWRTSVDSVLASRVTFPGNPRAGWSATGDRVDASDTTQVPISIAADLVTGHAFAMWITDPWNVRVQRFSLATAGVDPNAQASEFAITALAPNPSRAAFTLRFRLPRAQSVRAEAFDIVGRRLVATESSVLSAGEHALELRLPPDAAPGVYRVRMVSAGRALTRTAIRLR